MNDSFVGNDFGLGRGTPVDRWYIHQFFVDNAGLIRGSCLEFGELTYVNRYGNNVSHKVVFNYSDSLVLHDGEMRGDISIIESLPDSKFDCIVCVNVLNFIYDIKSALLGLGRMLKKNGVVILTVAGPTAHISRYDMVRWGDYWRFTDKSITQLVGEAGLLVENVKTYGNPLSCVTQINGYCVEDIGVDALITSHSDYQLVIGLVVRKL
jgi:SAM-dependent methyltransferase